MMISARPVSVAIFVLFSLGLPAKAQSFNRQDLDCAVAATIEGRRAGTAKENITELTHFFLGRLVAQDDENNWARVVYDRSNLKQKFVSAELLPKCMELYRQSLRR